MNNLDLERVKKWAELAGKLKWKYLKEKKDILKSIYKSIKKNKPFSNNLNELFNILKRKEIPLYNNIVNYSNILKGMLSSYLNNFQDENIKGRISFLIYTTSEEEKISGEIRNIINEQIKLTNQIINKQIEPENLKNYLSNLENLTKQELKLIKESEKKAKNFKKQSKEILKYCLNLLKKAEDLYLKSTHIAVESSRFLARYKKELQYIYFASAVISAISLMFGTTLRGIDTNIRRITQILLSLT